MKKRKIGMKAKIGGLFLAVSAVAFSVTGCQNSKEETTKETEKQVVKIGTMDLVNGDLIARAEKYYESKIDAKVEIVPFDSGQDVNKAIAAGSIDLSELGSSPAALGIANQLKYDVIGIGDILGKAEALVAKKGKQIEKIEDLKGKKIATPFASTGHYSLLHALKFANIKESEVEILDMEPDDIQAAWQRGDIDAAYVWYPVLNQLKQDGIELTNSEELSKKGAITADLLIARSDFSSKNPEIVTQFLEALQEANQLYQTDYKKTVADVSKILNISEDDADIQIQGTKWLLADEQLKEEYLGGGIAKTLKETADFLVEQKSITSAPDLKTFEKHVKTEFLQKVIDKK